MIITDIIYALCVMLFDFAVMYLLLDVKPKKAKRFKLALSILVFSLSLLSSFLISGIYGRSTFSSYYFPIVQLPIHIKNDKLFIRITNPYDGVVKFQDDIPVAEAEGHGIGTKSIMNIAKKYNGLYSFTAEENIFVLSVII